MHFCRGRDPKYMVCGFSTCKECAENDKCCENQSNQGLDRDKDKSEVKSCPPGFVDRGWKTYDLWTPAADVYLRICGNEYTPTDNCDQTIEVDGWWRRMSELRRAQAMKREKALQKARALKREVALRRLLN